MIAIPVTFGPYQKLAEGMPDFMFKETVEVGLPRLASNAEKGEVNAIFFKYDLFTAS